MIFTSKHLEYRQPLSFSTTPKPRWPIWKHPTLPQPSPKPLSHKLPVRKPLCQAVARASSSTAFKRLQVTYCTWKTVQLRVSLFVLFRSKFTRRPVFLFTKKTRTHTMCTTTQKFFLTPSNISGSPVKLATGVEQWNMRPGKPQNNSSPPINDPNGMIRLTFSVQSCIFEMTRRWGLAASVWELKVWNKLWSWIFGVNNMLRIKSLVFYWYKYTCIYIYIWLYTVYMYCVVFQSHMIW